MGKSEKLLFLSTLIKISILVLNLITESAEKLAIYDLLFLVARCCPKNDSKHPSEMRNWYHISHFAISKAFPGLGPILTTGLKY